jgi:alkylation response protein AidB-like acyl-CoA dehydrogenase
MNLDGTLSDEESIIKESLEEYCRKNVVPAYEGWIRERKFPRKLLKDLSQLIFGATVLPKGEGGLNEVTLGLLSETMGRYEVPVSAFLTMHFAKMLPLISDENTRKSYLDRYLSGELVLCGAFTEPGFGSDSASITTSAVPENKEFVINGEKAFVSSPGIADAHIISVRTSNVPDEKKHKGISLMIVEGGEQGVEPYEDENMASLFQGDFGRVRLNNVRIPSGNLIGGENEGFAILMNILGIQRVHVGLYAIGLAMGALEEAIEYARTRKVFGDYISKYEAISFRIAEDWSKLQSARMMAFKALAMSDSGIDNGAESSAVKGFGCEASFEAVSHALQTLGAAGYVKTSALERKFRASRGFLIGDGTPEVQKLIIARKLFGKNFAP